MLNISNRISINTIGGGGDGLTKIFDNYGFLNMWTSENLLVSGTTTTLYDYAGEHDLVNPAAGNQPTYNATDSDFNGLPSLSFDGTTDFLQKLVANYRIGDGSGVVISVFKETTNTTIRSVFASSDNAGTVHISFGQIGGKLGYYITTAAQVTGTTNDTTAKVSAMSSDSTTPKVWLNGVDDTASTVSADWFDSVSLRDDISIGAVMRSSPLYYPMDLVFVGYMPYTNDAAITSVSNELKTYYGI